MSAALTAEIDGQTFTVDLSKVTALEGLAFRLVTGEELDPAIGRLIAVGQVGPIEGLTDLALTKWLWTRQNVDPMARLVDVFQSVTLLPQED